MQEPTLREFLAADARLHQLASEQIETLEDQAATFVTREELAEWETAFLAKLERRLKQERAYTDLWVQMRTSVAASILRQLRRIFPQTSPWADHEYNEWLKTRPTAQAGTQRQGAIEV